MDFATGALGALLPKLAQLLRDEYNLQKGARKDIEFLTSELETMYAALRKVGEVPREQLEELQRIWARDVRELSYDMEDIVDTFMVRVQGAAPPSKRSAKRFIKKMTNIVTKAMTRREVAQEIKDIKERVREVAERRDRYRVDDISPAKKTIVDPRITAFYTKASELVGIDEAKEEVITMLTKEDDCQQRRIVSIAGFGGLGKTTLAKAVYDEIKGQFGSTAFISVSRNPDPNKLLKDMLYELHKGGQHPGANLGDIKQLIDLVREFLENKRYLIVIDDIWDIEPWKIIRCALDIENNLGSRIITTTRIIGVAEQVGGCYRLKPLSDESSEILFFGRIFGSVDKCPQKFYEISNRILRKCGGVPLAIVTTSSLLANKSKHIKVWYDVCDSIGSGLGRNPDMDDMTKILMLSYYDLPSHLKTCLLYLSVFPEDYEIEKDRLIWIWVAEGFVQHGQGHQSFHEMGESYFNELLNRSLIQPACMDVMDGTPQACRVHDTVLDLIISLSIEESFITTTTLLDDEVKSMHVRRLSLYNYTTWPTMKMPKLRSLTIFKPAYVLIDPMPSLSRYHLLRVLDLRGSRLENLASLGFVGSLCHLRYLALPSTRCSKDELPVEIGKLQFLQILDFSKTGVVAELPSSITGLKQLICLRGRRTYSYSTHEWTRLPDGLKKLSSLEVLEPVIVVSKCIAEELGNLMQLRVLKVLVDGYESDDWRACTGALVKSLGRLKKIESLHIVCAANLIDPEGSLQSLDNLTRLYLDTRTVPTWIGSAWLPALSYLDMVVGSEQREDIQVLGTLPCLRHLNFSVYHAGDQQKERCVLGPDAFPSLVRCKFNIDGRGVVPSMFPRGAMPKLQKFVSRIKLEDFLSGDEFTIDDDLALDHLPSLRSVSVNFTDGFDTYDTIPVLGRARYKLKHEAAVHPNHPRTRVKYMGLSL